MKRNTWVPRVLAVAAIALSFAGAAGGGILFGRAVSTPPELDAAHVVERSPDAASTQRASARPRAGWPTAHAFDKARDLAETRTGTISFAAIGPRGRELSHEADRPFFSASVSKAMLLVAELRRLRRVGAPLDVDTQALLEQMITRSDNSAADAIYARVGDAGLNEVAKIAGMAQFSGNVGHWSNVRLSAGDLALFMSKLDELLDLPGGKQGSELLSSIVPEQSWGIPRAVPDAAKVRFKGGWRPSEAGQLVHQMARVDLDGQSYSVAVLTDGNPSVRYGEETIRLVAEELLATD